MSWEHNLTWLFLKLSWVVIWVSECFSCQISHVWMCARDWSYLVTLNTSVACKNKNVISEKMKLKYEWWINDFKDIWYTGFFVCFFLTNVKMWCLVSSYFHGNVFPFQHFPVKNPSTAALGGSVGFWTGFGPEALDCGCQLFWESEDRSTAGGQKEQLIYSPATKFPHVAFTACLIKFTDFGVV